MLLRRSTRREAFCVLEQKMDMARRCTQRKENGFERNETHGKGDTVVRDNCIFPSSGHIQSSFGGVG